MNKLTLERIQELVIAADREALCQAMAPLTEAERAELAPAAIQLAAQVDQYCCPFDKVEVPDEAKGLAKKILKSKYPDWRSPRWTSQLLLVGLGDAEILKNPHKFKVGWARTDLKDMQQRMLQILDARRPKWLADWLKWEWKQESPIAGWYLERGLIRSGALPPNDTPEYYARMAAEDRVIHSEYVDTHDSLPLFKSRRDMLEADPELFQHDIWRLLETDTFAFRYAHFGWPDLLMELSQAGKLDRAKLLARCVHGMSLPLSVTTLGGLVKFHDQLSPSNNERQVLLPGYLQLLHQNHSGVVSLAISNLDKLHRIEKLSADDFAQHVPAVFSLEKKGAVKAALKLAESLAYFVRDTDKQLKIARAIVGGLHHPEADIQRATLEALYWSIDLFDAPLAEAIAAAGNTVANAVKPEWKKLLAKLGNKSSTANATTSDANVTSPPAESTQAADPNATNSKRKKSDSKPKKSTDTNAQESSSLPAATSEETTTVQLAPSGSAWDDIPKLLAQRSQLSAAVHAMQQGAAPVVLPVRKHHPPRRDPNRAIAPIADVDELIATLSAVLHRIDDVMQLERCLDGILRFNSNLPDDFSVRSAALQKTLAKRLDNYQYSYDMLASIGFLKIVAMWFRLPTPNCRWHGHWYEMRYWFLRARCFEIEDTLVGKPGMPMLAMPTHADGWLDPEVLVTRINDSYAKEHELLPDYDLAQAILRLTPDGRQAALKRLQKPDHYNGGIELRYALGDDVEPVFNARDSLVQMAAVRARMVSLAEQDYQPALPIAQAHIDDRQRIIVSGALTEDPTVPFSLWEKALSFEPQVTEVLDPQHPFAWRDSWEALTNPMDHAADCLAGRTSHLFDPESTWTPEACRLAILAASYERNEVRLATTDAIIEAITRLLIIPEIFGATLAQNLSHIKLNRVSKVLSDAASASELHHWIILQACQSCIDHLPALPGDIHLVLAVMLESAATLEVDVQPATKEKLKTLDPKNKSGKLAKQLQKLAASDPKLMKIHSAIVEATANRARRWQSLGA